MYSLLAITTSRMRWLSLCKVEGPMAPERFVVKSIRALRRFLESGQAPDDRVLMDLAFLTMTEFFTGKIRSGIYTKLIKDFVIACGGFPRLDPFVGYILIATDWKISATFMKAPIFDFLSCPALLGLDLADCVDDKSRERALQEVLKSLDPRVMIRVKNSIALQEVVGTIHRLNVPLCEEICRYVTRYQRLQYRWCAQCLRVRDERCADPEIGDQVMAADLLDQRTKTLGFRIWLWHVTMSFSDSETLSTDLVQSASNCFAGDCAEMLRCLASAESLLQDTDWMLDQRTLLWKLALAVTVAPKTDDMIYVTTAIRRVGQGLNIETRETFHKALSDFWPFDRFESFNLDKILQIITGREANKAFKIYRPSQDRLISFTTTELLSLKQNMLSYATLKAEDVSVS